MSDERLHVGAPDVAELHAVEVRDRELADQVGIVGASRGSEALRCAALIVLDPPLGVDLEALA